MTVMGGSISFTVGDSQQERTDFAVLVVGATRYVAERLDAAVAEAGIEGMRAPYGFVIRALHGSPLTLTALADRLGVTKQAAIKVVDEMEARGFVTRTPLPGDRRAKAIALTERGEAVRRAARAESERMESELRADLGAGDVEALRRVLLSFVERHGGGADASAGRARPVW
jgi:DNA-binding MarR family transcriptional regulator